MIKTLYETFQHWAEKGSVYIFSDTHFDDPDCKLIDTNWITPQEQIDIINKVAHKNDTLILLGDVGNIEWVKKLKAGYKVLITGNHDKGVENYKRKITKKREWLTEYINKNGMECGYYILVPEDNKLFDEVYTGPLMISDKIILSHEPIPNIDWALNIHGHNHSNTISYDVRGGYGNSILLGQLELPKSKDIYHINVCSNTINYTPVNLKDIINSGVLKNIESLHRQTIDEATERRK